MSFFPSFYPCDGFLFCAGCGYIFISVGCVPFPPSHTNKREHLSIQKLAKITEQQNSPLGENVRCSFKNVRKAAGFSFRYRGENCYLCMGSFINTEQRQHMGRYTEKCYYLWAISAFPYQGFGTFWIFLMYINREFCSWY